MGRNNELGMVHVYTGNGKGKTTAAFGLVARALCAGFKVYVGQFVKSMKYNETRLQEYFPTQLLVEQLGSGCFIHREASEQDKEMAKEGLAHCAEIMASGEYDVVVLDELTIATYFQMLGTEEIIRALEGRAAGVEVVITGRYAPQELLDYADLVTDMQEVKHYYSRGILSRNGIDR